MSALMAAIEDAVDIVAAQAAQATIRVAEAVDDGARRRRSSTSAFA